MTGELTVRFTIELAPGDATPEDAAAALEPGQSSSDGEPSHVSAELALLNERMARLTETVAVLLAARDTDADTPEPGPF